MNGTLDDPIARIQRARDHYCRLKDGVGGVDLKLRPVVLYPHDPDGLEYGVYVGELEPISNDWPLLYGEAFFNLRSALDHLAFQLHVRRYRGQVPPAVEGQSAFPIYTVTRVPKDRRGNPTPTSKWSQIKNLGARDRAAIEYLQPYRGVGDDYPPRTLVRRYRRALLDVNRINNIDKHRNLHVVHTAAHSVPNIPRLEQYGLVHDPAFGKPLESHACIDRWTFRTAPPPEEMDVDELYMYSTVGLDLPDGTRLSALEHLGGCILLIASIIDRFSARFPTWTAGPLDLTMIGRVQEVLQGGATVHERAHGRPMPGRPIYRRLAVESPLGQPTGARPTAASPP